MANWKNILANVIAIPFGLAFLWIPCLLRAWEPCDSTEGPWAVHTIDQWKWKWLRPVYNNPEDGVSGTYALVWTQGESAQGKADRVLVRVYYRANMWAPLRAYLWSAWRNTADQLKYYFKE